MLNMATADAEAKGLLVSIRHTGDVADSLAEAQRILGFAESVAKKHVELMNALADVPVSRAAFADFTTLLIPIPEEMERKGSREETRDLLIGLYKHSKTLVGVPETAYRAYQVVAEYADHQRPLRIGADTPTAVAADRRFRSITEGPAAELKTRGLELLQPFLVGSAN
jgi:hypothetical protein